MKLVSVFLNFFWWKKSKDQILRYLTEYAIERTVMQDRTLGHSLEPDLVIIERVKIEPSALLTLGDQP